VALRQPAAHDPRRLSVITGPAPAEDKVARLGYWPAVVALVAFGWLELAYPERSRPATVGTFLVLYAVVQLVASLWFGPGWFARGDAFEVVSTLWARLSPFGRRDDGRLVVRNPLDGVDGLRAEAGLAGVVVALLGITAYDGVSRTQWWQSGPGIEGDVATLVPTLGLAGTLLAVTGLYAGASALAGRLGWGGSDGPTQFAHTLVPIALGYHVAHYFSLLLLDGQLTWILVSDPFQTGADLFGTASNSLDLTAVSPETIAGVQVASIVLGHVLGVVLAHDRAVRLCRPGRSRTSQYPLLAVMVAFTVGGLALLLAEPGGGRLRGCGRCRRPCRAERCACRSFSACRCAVGTGRSSSSLSREGRRPWRPTGPRGCGGAARRADAPTGEATVERTCARRADRRLRPGGRRRDPS
jgi:hypothetical protein